MRDEDGWEERAVEARRECLRCAAERVEVVCWRAEVRWVMGGGVVGSGGGWTEVRSERRAG